MSKSIHAQAAAAIRKELKAMGFKASVSGSAYTGGSSVVVSMNQATTDAEAKEIRVTLNKYQAGNFNGMEDAYDYSNKNDNLPQVKFVRLSILK